jgi:hypothetical protein
VQYGLQSPRDASPACMLCMHICMLAMLAMNRPWQLPSLRECQRHAVKSVLGLDELVLSPCSNCSHNLVYTSDEEADGSRQAS